METNEEIDELDQEEEINIYGDIGDFDLGEEIEKLKAENKKLEKHIGSLNSDIEKLNSTITELKETQNNLTKNISALYMTAKAEIERKNRMIEELRTQLDDKQLGRYNPEYKSKRKDRENSPSEDSVSKKFKLKDNTTKVDSDKQESITKDKQEPRSKYSDRQNNLEADNRYRHRSNRSNDRYNEQYGNDRYDSRSRYPKERCIESDRFEPKNKHNDRYNTYEDDGYYSRSKNLNDRHRNDSEDRYESRSQHSGSRHSSRTSNRSIEGSEVSDDRNNHYNRNSKSYINDGAVRDRDEYTKEQERSNRFTDDNRHSDRGDSSYFRNEQKRSSERSVHSRPGTPSTREFREDTSHKREKEAPHDARDSESRRSLTPMPFPEDIEVPKPKPKKRLKMLEDMEKKVKQNRLSQTGSSDSPLKITKQSNINKTSHGLSQTTNYDSDKNSVTSNKSNKSDKSDKISHKNLHGKESNKNKVECSKIETTEKLNAQNVDILTRIKQSPARTEAKSFKEKCYSSVTPDKKENVSKIVPQKTTKKTDILFTKNSVPNLNEESTTTDKSLKDFAQRLSNIVEDDIDTIKQILNIQKSSAKKDVTRENRSNSLETIRKDKYEKEMQIESKPSPKDISEKSTLQQDKSEDATLKKSNENIENSIRSTKQDEKFEDKIKDSANEESSVKKIKKTTEEVSMTLAKNKSENQAQNELKTSLKKCTEKMPLHEDRSEETSMKNLDQSSTNNDNSTKQSRKCEDEIKKPKDQENFMTEGTEKSLIILTNSNQIQNELILSPKSPRKKSENRNLNKVIERIKNSTESNNSTKQETKCENVIKEPKNLDNFLTAVKETLEKAFNITTNSKSEKQTQNESKLYPRNITEKSTMHREKLEDTNLKNSNENSKNDPDSNRLTKQNQISDDTVKETKIQKKNSGQFSKNQIEDITSEQTVKKYKRIVRFSEKSVVQNVSENESKKTKDSQENIAKKNVNKVQKIENVENCGKTENKDVDSSKSEETCIKYGQRHSNRSSKQKIISSTDEATKGVQKDVNIEQIAKQDKKKGEKPKNFQSRTDEEQNKEESVNVDSSVDKPKDKFMKKERRQSKERNMQDVDKEEDTKESNKMSKNSIEQANQDTMKQDVKRESKKDKGPIKRKDIEMNEEITDHSEKHQLNDIREEIKEAFRNSEVKNTNKEFETNKIDNLSIKSKEPGHDIKRFEDVKTKRRKSTSAHQDDNDSKSITKKSEESAIEKDVSKLKENQNNKKQKTEGKKKDLKNNEVKNTNKPETDNLFITSKEPGHDIKSVEDVKRKQKIYLSSDEDDENLKSRIKKSEERAIKRDVSKLKGNENSEDQKSEKTVISKKKQSVENTQNQDKDTDIKTDGKTTAKTNRKSVEPEQKNNIKETEETLTSDKDIGKNEGTDKAKPKLTQGEQRNRLHEVKRRIRFSTKEEVIENIVRKLESNNKTTTKESMNRSTVDTDSNKNIRRSSSDKNNANITTKNDKCYDLVEENLKKIHESKNKELLKRSKTTKEEPARKIVQNQSSSTSSSSTSSESDSSSSSDDILTSTKTVDKLIEIKDVEQEKTRRIQSFASLSDSSTSDETVLMCNADNPKAIEKKFDSFINNYIENFATENIGDNPEKIIAPNNNVEVEVKKKQAELSEKVEKSAEPKVKVLEVINIVNARVEKPESSVASTSKVSTDVGNSNSFSSLITQTSTPNSRPVRRRITPTPVKEDKPLCSFENILTKTQHCETLTTKTKESPLHLTHEGEIPILHLEENHINDLPTEVNINDKNIINLLDSMNISNIDCDIAKFSSETTVVSEVSAVEGTAGLTFENKIEKVTSTPVKTEGKQTGVSDVSNRATSCGVSGSSSSLDKTPSSAAQPVVTTSTIRRKRRRCWMIIRD